MRRTTFSLNQLETRDTPATGFTASGAAPGGQPLVGVFRADGSALAQFPAFEDSFRGGVRVAAGEIDGDPNTQDVVAAAGPGGGPAVKVFSVDVRTGAVTQRSSFFAFEPTFAGGVRVAVGNVLNRSTGTGQIILGAGEGGGPRVRVVNGDGSGVANSPLADFFPFESSFRGGVQVAAGELDGNASDGDELVAAAGTGGGPRVRVFRSDGAALADYYAFASSFRGGANVSVADTGGRTGVIVPDAYALDPSQRNNGLNTAAQAAAQPTTGQTAGTTGGTASNFGGVTAGTLGQVGSLGQVGTTGTLNNGLTTGGSGTLNNGLTTGVTSQNLGAGGFTTQGLGTTGLSTQTTGAGGFGTQATGGTGFGTQATGATGIGTQGLGTTGFTTQGLQTAGFGTQATGLTGIGAQGTGVGGITGATTAAGVSANTQATAGLNVPSAFAFGPFGDPGQPVATPAFANPAYTPGVSRYTIPG